MKPTEICRLSECSAENCRRREIKDPLPKELLMEAWKASVGYSFESNRTHEACNCQPCFLIEDQLRSRCIKVCANHY